MMTQDQIVQAVRARRGQWGEIARRAGVSIWLVRRLGQGAYRSSLTLRSAERLSAALDAVPRK